MGGGCTTNDQIKFEKKIDSKIESLEMEMRELSLDIAQKEKELQRLKIQNRQQEAALLIQKIRRLQEKQTRCRNRINRADRNKEFLDKRVDMADDLADQKETETIAQEIKIDVNDAIRVEDQIRNMDCEMNSLEQMINISSSDDIVTQLNDEIKKMQKPQGKKESRENKEKDSEGYKIMDQIVEKVREKKWIEVNKLCSECMKLKYDLKQTYFYKGKAQYNLEAYEDAINTFEIAETLQHDKIRKSKIFQHIGMCHLQEKNINEAKKAFNNSITTNDKNWNSYFELGKLLKDDDIKKSVEYLKKAYGYSGYECSEANELLKKLKTEEALIIVKSKEVEEKDKKKVELFKMDEIKKMQQFYYQSKPKYLIQSIEYHDRCLTINSTASTPDAEVVLFNFIGNHLNQLWYIENNIILSCLNQKYLSYNEKDNTIYLDEKVGKRFFIQGKLIVNEKGMVLDIKEKDNPSDTLLEMDLMGKGQRNSQYWRLIPVEDQENKKREVEEKKKQQMMIQQQQMIQQQKLQMQQQQKQRQMQVQHQQQQVQVQQQLQLQRQKLQMQQEQQKRLRQILDLSMKRQFNELLNLLSSKPAGQVFEGINLHCERTGNTALINALAANRTDVIKQLLLHGANPNKPNKYGSTPLHLCVSWNRKHMIRLLVSAGANPQLLDQKGFNVFKYLARHQEAGLYMKLLTCPVGSNPNPETFSTPKFLLQNPRVVPQHSVRQTVGAQRRIIGIPHQQPIRRVVQQQPVRRVVQQQPVRRVVQQQPVRRVVQQQPVRRVVQQQPVRRVVQQQPVRRVFQQQPVRRVVQQPQQRRGGFFGQVGNFISNTINQQQPQHQQVNRRIVGQPPQRVVHQTYRH